MKSGPVPAPRAAGAPLGTAPPRRVPLPRRPAARGQRRAGGRTGLPGAAGLRGACGERAPAGGTGPAPPRSLTPHRPGQPAGQQQPRFSSVVSELGARSGRALRCGSCSTSRAERVLLCPPRLQLCIGGRVSGICPENAEDSYLLELGERQNTIAIIWLI